MVGTKSRTIWGPTDLDLLLCNYKADININVYKGHLHTTA